MIAEGCAINQEVLHYPTNEQLEQFKSISKELQDIGNEYAN